MGVVLHCGCEIKAEYFIARKKFGMYGGRDLTICPRCKTNLIDDSRTKRAEVCYDGESKRVPFKDFYGSENMKFLKKAVVDCMVYDAARRIGRDHYTWVVEEGKFDTDLNAVGKIMAMGAEIMIRLRGCHVDARDLSYR